MNPTTAPATPSILAPNQTRSRTGFMDRVDRPLRLLCALWLGVMAGFFYAFSVLVMPGLAEIDPAAAIPAMRGINDAIGNPFFALGFFGAVPLSLLAIVVALVRRDLGSGLAGLGGGLYLLGTFVVTVAFNIPLNDELDGREPDRAADTARMADWIADWSAWNDLRTGAAVLAFTLVAASLLVAPGRRRAAEAMPRPGDRGNRPRRPMAPHDGTPGHPLDALTGRRQPETRDGAAA